VTGPSPSPWPTDLRETLAGGCGHDHDVVEWAVGEGLVEPISEAVAALGYEVETHQFVMLRFPALAGGFHVAVLAVARPRGPFGLSSADGADG
jgi:hypothetical protein